MLSGAVRERPRVGPWSDHGVVVAVRLRPGARGERRRGAGASGGVLRGVAGVPVGVVPPAVRAEGLELPGARADVLKDLSTTELDPLPSITAPRSHRRRGCLRPGLGTLSLAVARVSGAVVRAPTGMAMFRGRGRRLRGVSG
jgi:hypothetical protein